MGKASYCNGGDNDDGDDGGAKGDDNDDDDDDTLFCKPFFHPCNYKQAVWF